MRSRAFTLIELLLAVAILAGIAALVAPSLAGSAARRRVDTAARSIVALASAARARAAAEGRAYVLIVDGTERTVKLARARDPLVAAVEGTDPELDADDWTEDSPWGRPVPFEDGVTLVSAEVGSLLAGEAPFAARVTFSPDGSAEAARFELEGVESERRVVRISAANGRAAIVEEAAQ